MHSLDNKERGMTLLEALLAVVIISTLASIAVPMLSVVQVRQLDRIANEFVQAVRFAQSEAIRTGIPYGFNVFSNDTALILYSHGGSWAIANVYHPIRKTQYSMSFGTSENPVVITSKAIKFDSLSVNYQTYITFAAGTGIPVSTGAVGAKKLLEYANFTFAYGGHTATVNIAPISGTVTVQ